MTRRTCSVSDCDSPTAGRGWCAAHYMRWRRSGDPLGSTLKDPRARFTAMLGSAATGYSTPCHVWMGAVSDRGYGNFWLHGRTVLAHRQAFEWAVGPIPPGLELDHLCRVTRCVNPAHLEVVTHAENNRRQPVNAGRFGSREQVPA